MPIIRQMRNRWITTIIGVVMLTAALGGLLGVLTNVAHSPPASVSGQDLPSNSTPTGSAANPNGLKIPFDISLNQDLLAALQNLDLSPQGGLLPHIPLFNIQGASGTSLLQDTITNYYDGNVWKFMPDQSFKPYTGQSLNEAISGYSSRSASAMTITPLAAYPSTETSLPVSQYVTKLSAPGPVEYLPEDGIFKALGGFPDSYSFQASNYQYDEFTLEKASADARPEYLQLPASITDRTRQLAQDLTQNVKGPYNQAKAIEQYLKNNYTYDYNYQTAPTGHEPNDWFLFDEKKGVCTNFNSAFVTLARAAGIPSRLVGGYAITPQKDDQPVYADQAHAWSEVKFQDLGWIAFDATGTSPALLSTRTQITAVSSVVLKDQSFEVSGIVTAGDTEVDGNLVELYVNPLKSPIGGTLIGQTTVTDGVFKLAVNLPPEVDVGRYQLMAHALASARFQESWSDPEIKVMSQTQIHLDVASRAKPAEWLTLTGFLTDSAVKPLADQLINITLDGQDITQVFSDEHGKFTWQQSFSTPGSHEIDAGFSGTEYYLPTDQKTQIQIVSGGIPWWQFALTVLAILSVLGGGFWLYRRQTQKPITHLPQPSQTAAPVNQPTETVSRTINLSIDFPQIKPPLPDVWGQNDELTVQCRLMLTAGAPLVEKKIELSLGKPLANLKTGMDGNAHVVLTITRRGQYNLIAQYTTETTVRRLRIVDYREEVVDLYKHLLIDLRSQGVDLPSNATPREIEHKILAGRPDIPQSALDMLIYCFEEADYSLHPVTRRIYEEMYLAQNEIKSYVSQSK